MYSIDENLKFKNEKVERLKLEKLRFEKLKPEKLKPKLLVLVNRPEKLELSNNNYSQ